VRAAHSKVGSEFRINVNNYLFFNGSGYKPTVIPTLPNVTTVHGDSYGFYSGYVDLPITVEFFSSRRDVMFYGSYDFSLDIKGVAGISTGGERFYWQWGQPYTIGFHDGVSLYCSDGASSPSGSLTISSAGSYFKSRFDFSVEARSLFLPYYWSDVDTCYDFLVRIPFTVSYSQESINLVRPGNFDFTCEAYSFRSKMFKSDTPQDWMSGIQGAVTEQIAGKIEESKQQAHQDAQDLKGQMESNAQQAHQDAERAHQDAEKASEERKSIFDAIRDFFGGFFDNLINAVVRLFVPDDSVFQDFMNEILEFLNEHLGVLMLPFDLISRLLDLLRSEGDAVLTLPSFSIMGHTVWNDIEFNLTEGLSEFSALLDAVQLGTSVLIIGCFLLYCQKKFDQTIGGASE